MLSEGESRVELVNRFKNNMIYKSSGAFSLTQSRLDNLFNKRLIDFSGMDLSHMVFDDLDLSCVILDKCNLVFSSFRRAAIRSSSLLKAELNGAILDNCFLDCCDISEAIFKGASLKGAVIKNPLSYLTSFEKSDLTGAKFSGRLDFIKTDFRETKGVNIVQFCINGIPGYIFNGKVHVRKDVEKVDNLEEIVNCLKKLTIN